MVIPPNVSGEVGQPAAPGDATDSAGVGLAVNANAQLTGDELAARIRAELGIFVVAGTTPLGIGQVLPSGFVDGPNVGRLRTPFIVVSEATGSEFEAQVKLAMRIDPSFQRSDFAPRKWPYFYRVEAAD